MRLQAIIFTLICLVFGTGIAFVVASRTISWIERAQVAELEQSIYAGGIDWLNFEADGFSVLINGVAPDERQQAKAVQIAGMIVGDGLIDETTVAAAVIIAPELTQPMVEIMRNGEDISLIGRLPIGAGRRVLDDAILSLETGVAVVDISEPFTDTPPVNWASALGFATQILSQTDRAIITVTPGQVIVEAVAGSANWQDGLEELLKNMRPADVELHINISAPRQIISPYRFSFDFDNPTVAKCSAQNEIEVQNFRKILAAAALPSFDCEIGLGAPSADWGQVVGESLELLLGLGGGSIVIEDSDISIVAPIGTDPILLAEYIEQLRTQFPDVFSLHSSIIPTPPTDEELAEITPAVFGATLSTEGIVSLSGTLKDALTGDVVVRYAESKFGYNLVDSGFSDHAELPAGWQKRVFASVDALSLLETGNLVMTPALIELSGIASFESPESEITTLLKAALGRSVQFDLSLTYEPRDEVVENALDPRVCAARITTILDENKISFAPSSAVIEESSKPTIEAITAILANCRKASFEIGGHTDSQGREEMNLALSQSRADSVLDAILQQNLLLGKIAAVGYGEAEPIADNETEEGRAENRRIVIKLLRNTDHTNEEETSDEQN